MTYIPRSSVGSGKKNVMSPIPKVVKKKKTFRVFNFIGMLLLVLSLLGTAGVFFLEHTSNTALEEAKTGLRNAKNEVGDSQAKIAQIKQYNNQLKTARILLDNHLSASKLFDALELNTVGTVQFSNFEYTYDPGFDAYLSLGGITEEFVSVVLQEKQLGFGGVPFEVSLLGDISRANQDIEDENNNSNIAPGLEAVSFSVTGLLRSEDIRYEGNEYQEMNQSDTDLSLDEPDGDEVGDQEDDGGVTDQEPEDDNQPII